MDIRETTPRQLLTKTNGYLAGYDYTLNPYVGCVYGCHYCYVRALPVARFHPGDWGTYVDVKQIDGRAFVRELQSARRRGSVNIFMSSSTDPYQPVEAQMHRTRQILDILLQDLDVFDFLLIQTRSPLVANDADRIRALGNKALVSLTIETDSEEVRKRFTPHAPPIAARMQALAALQDEGVQTQVAVSPILPFGPQFPELLRNVTQDVVLDDYFTGDGANGRRTAALQIHRKYHADELSKWYTKAALHKAYQHFVAVFGQHHVFRNQNGFLPPTMRRAEDTPST
ncbi:SPL family radical SAM protein [Alicyclobacillus suci]|uniref:SPL family radical SAM protein n=1 Tax=Alicyclobacillus suci TaxID=2816080 RepID=UPI001A90142A|nr:radical SAM protein [Alicyclobacillus suci]